MRIADEKLKLAFKKVSILRDQLNALCLGKQGLEVRVMDLHYVVEQVYGLKIEMCEVSFQAVYLRGNVERYEDNTARVLVRANLSKPEKRLATVKELCHLALDEKEDWSPDGTAMLEAIIADTQGVDLPADHASTSAMESEAIALIAAGELMYPSEFREPDAAKLAAKVTTVSAIAMQHDVPPFVVEQALRMEERYKKLRETSYGLAAE